MKPKKRLFATHTLPSKLVFTAGIVAAGIVTAQAATWTGAINNDWNTVGNWDANPAGQNVFINSGLINVPVLSGTPSFTPVDIFIGQGGGTGQLDQSAGTLATGANNWMFVGVDGGSNGSYNLSGTGSATASRLLVGATNGTGTININTTGSVSASYIDGGAWWQNSSIVVGDGGTGNGTINLQNGTVNSTGDMWVGAWGGTGLFNQTGGTVNARGIHLGQFFGSGTMSVANGTVNAQWVTLSNAGNGGDLSNSTLNVLGGGVVNSENDLIVGQGGNGTSQSLLNIDGGTVNVGTTTERWMIVGNYDGVNSTVNVKNGGTLKLNANTDLRTGVNGNFGTRVIDVDGGSIIGYSDNGVTANGDASLELGRVNSAASDTLNIKNGGLVQVRAIYTNANTTSAIINFDNGTLRATGNDANLINLAGTGTRQVNVLAGGATVDSNGFDVTIHNGLLNGGGNGGLNKDGAGKLTLLGASTYTGATNVNAGTLALGATASLASTQITVDSGATFDVSAQSYTVASGVTVTNNGTVTGNVTVASGGTVNGAGSFTGTATIAGELSPGNSPGLVTFTNGLELTATSNLDWELDANTELGAGTNFDQVLVTGGSLTVADGAILNLDFGGTVDFTDAFWTSDRSWTVIDFAGTGDEGALTLGSITGGVGDYNEFGSFSTSNNGGDQVLTWTAVPEPTAALLGGLGMLGLLRRRRQA